MSRAAKRPHSWLSWQGMSSYSAIMLNSMTKEEVSKAEKTDNDAFIKPINPRSVTVKDIDADVKRNKAKKTVKKKVVKKKAAKKAVKKTEKKKKGK